MPKGKAGNRTGKGGFGDHPENRLSGNVPKGTREAGNKFKDMVLRYANDEAGFAVWAKTYKTELYKMAASLVPKEIDANVTGRFILICGDDADKSGR